MTMTEDQTKLLVVGNEGTAVLLRSLLPKGEWDVVPFGKPIVGRHYDLILCPYPRSLGDRDWAETFLPCRLKSTNHSRLIWL